MLEEKTASSTASSVKPSMSRNWAGDEGVVPLAAITTDQNERFSSGLKEFDRILGGGFVEGSLVLVGGDPGIGKSTLLLQICNLADRKGQILYVSGEESKAQIRMRAGRLGIDNPAISLCSQTSYEFISETISSLKPSLCVIDSIQTLYSEELTSAPGSVSQTREVTAGLLRLAKNLMIPIILVGHVTKDGVLAGPRVIEHMVDTVIYFEGENAGPFRMTRAVKNRFGATGELAFFEMTDSGLMEVENASSILLSGRPMHSPGSVVTTAMEGSRPVYIEIQALLAPSSFSIPQRMAQGLDRGRVSMLLAILEKKLSLGINNLDAYINVIGGLKITERACDLAILAAVFSALKDMPIRPDTLVIGEVGLTGEIRPVDSIASRLSESERFGFSCCILPSANKSTMDKLSKNIASNTRSNAAECATMSLPELIYVDSLSEAIDILFSSDRIK
jgi:DNA repair protein RadA/Sms